MYEWKAKAVNQIFLDENTGGKGRYFKSRFLQPGLVKYSFGVCVLEKDTIDKFIQGFVGCPVIIGHNDVTNENAKELSCGNICHIWYDESDGWYWGDGIIDDEMALEKINNGYNVSCQYEITEYSNNTSGALHNGNPYDKVILNGKPEHLAIVENPRYENAMIAVNALDLTAENEDKWITVKPNGEENKGRHLLLKDGESPKEAMQRQWGVYDKRQAKEEKQNRESEQKQEQKQEPKQEEKQNKESDQKPEQKEDTKETSLDQYITDKSDRGFLYQTKGTTTYSNGEKRAEVEEFGEEGGKYRVDLYDGSRRKEIKAYSTKRGMEKALREHLEGGANKETKALESVKDLGEAESHYKEVLKRYKENDSKRWQSGLSNAEYHKAWEEAEKAKKELTTARREYAESIMANFEEVENNPYEERQEARRERYEELSDKAQKTSDSYAQRGKEMFDAIPFGQPIHGQRDRNYRNNAWGKFESSWKEQKKAEYYANKAGSVGKAGISADDANAIAKLAKKYKSGVDSAEKRRIVDRVIDIHKRSTSEAPKTEDYSQYGFNVERNTDLNRLQLKFPGKPDEATRSILKSNGFRWSPREGAWQRQLNSNAEYSLKRIAEKLNPENQKVSNCIIEALNEIKDTDMFKKLFKKKEQKMDEQTLKKLFTECLQEVLIAKNEEDEEFEEEELEEKEKKVQNKCKNEDVDKRDIIRQIMAIAGKEEASEDVKTIAKLAEKLAYDKSEAGTADNCGKKGKNEDEEEDEDKKEEAKNKAKNSIDAIKGLFSKSGDYKPSSNYVTQSDAIDLGNKLF